MTVRTIRDVAQLAGVSVGTVSNVLNHPERVRSATLSRVNAVIEELGFAPNAAARALRLSPKVLDTERAASSHE